MIDHDIFKEVDRDEQCVNFAYAANSLVTTARFALENDAGGIGDEQRIPAACVVLEMVEAMMAVVIDGAETFERDQKKGVHAPKEASHAAA